MSKPLPTLSAEIFCDSDCGSIPTGTTETAIGYLGSITGGIEVIANSRKVKLANNPNQTYIEPSVIRWPAFRADINVVLTTRSVYFGEADDPLPMMDKALAAQLSATLGIAISNGKKPVALVDVVKSPAVTPIVVHELGHLFGLKEMGISKDPKSSHCLLDNCSMKATYEHRPLIVRDVPTGIKKVLGWAGINKPRYTMIEERVEPFCSECSEQVHKKAYFRRVRASGSYVPPGSY